MAVFPVYYAGNLAYFRALLAADDVVFEVCENFPKQTFRNRMEIVGPNGRQKLVIPTVKTGERRTMGNVQISYAENWQKDHWKSLEAAYRRSPYFEFYEDQLLTFYHSKRHHLLTFNLDFLQVSCSMLHLELPFRTTEVYQAEVTDDQRQTAFDQADHATYLQVFSDRHPFEPNLSILDALFNLGPQATTLLR